MTEHYTPEQAQAAAEAITRQQAAAVAGDPSAAGIYGDKAGRSDQAPAQSQEQVAEGLQAAGGQAAAVDVDALLKQLADLAARVQAVAPAAPPEPADTSLKQHIDQSAPAFLHTLVDALEARLEVIEGKLGL